MMPTELEQRRRELGMTYSALAMRSGVSESTLKRVVGDRLGVASFDKVSAIAEAMGMTLNFTPIEDAYTYRRQQARTKAHQLISLVQGSSVLEAQGLNPDELRRMRERTEAELLEGPKRRLWGT
jgi:transcriptional regulator with XRE-family HTH domain